MYLTNYVKDKKLLHFFIFFSSVEKARNLIRLQFLSIINFVHN